MKPREDYIKSLRNLRTELITMGVFVSESIEKVTRALANNSSEIAQRIIDKDKKIDELEMRIDDQCVAIIATENPVASDLRHIISSISVARELERMGDHAAHIAKSVLKISSSEDSDAMGYISEMGEICCQMSRALLSVLEDDDEKEARRLAKVDEKVDALYGKVNNIILKEAVNYGEADIAKALELNHIARYLERFADHITNSSEWIIYGQTGEHVDLSY